MLFLGLVGDGETECIFYISVSTVFAQGQDCIAYQHHSMRSSFQGLVLQRLVDERRCV